MTELDYGWYDYKPRYRIKWDFDNTGNITGYWVFTCNPSAIKLKSSFYVQL